LIVDKKNISATFYLEYIFENSFLNVFLDFALRIFFPKTYFLHSKFSFLEILIFEIYFLNSEFLNPVLRIILNFFKNDRMQIQNWYGAEKL